MSAIFAIAELISNLNTSKKLNLSQLSWIQLITIRIINLLIAHTYLRLKLWLPLISKPPNKFAWIWGFAVATALPSCCCSFPTKARQYCSFRSPELGLEPSSPWFAAHQKKQPRVGNRCHQLCQGCAPCAESFADPSSPSLSDRPSLCTRGMKSHYRLNVAREWWSRLSPVCFRDELPISLSSSLSCCLMFLMATVSWSYTFFTCITKP